MKNSVYFGENGLTSTSANHICNLAKELCQECEEKLKNVEFYNTTLSLIGSSEVSVIDKGVDSVDWIPEAIQTIGHCNSLIAWFREAIKAKENMLEELEDMNIEEYSKKFNLQVPERPVKESALTESEYYDTLSIHDKNKYYSLEAQASALGKYIHQNGSINKARKRLTSKIQKPHDVNGSGRDTLIYTYSPNVNLSDVDKLFFEMQKAHREVQASLNAMKFECDKAVKESNIQCEQKYRKDYEDYVNETNKLRNQMQVYVEEQTKIIGSLKIVIPDNLKTIYNKISQLGK